MDLKEWVVKHGLQEALDLKNEDWVDHDESMVELIDALAKERHNQWCKVMTRNGWEYGPDVDIENREHPGLLDWVDLHPVERAALSVIAAEIVKVIHALGYKIEPDLDDEQMPEDYDTDWEAIDEL